jgi:hypothetical protein
MDIVADDLKFKNNTIPNYKLARCEIIDNELVFTSDKDFYNALKDGFFLIEIPSEIEVSSGLKLCHNFYKEKDESPDDPYRGFKNFQEIYFDREHFQTEHILTNREAREKFFPTDMNYLANQMNDLAILILKDCLRKINIPENDWNKVTGNCVENNGTHWFACSHYRSEINKQGCPTHQDTGFVTVLYIDQPGLEALINQRWEKIDPVPGYFIVNFGRSFEILTEKMPIPVKSIYHRVTKTEKVIGQEDRVSMAAFTNIPNNLSLYQYDNDNVLKFYQTVEQFLTEFNQTTWDDKHENFGLTS